MFFDDLISLSYGVRLSQTWQKNMQSKNCVWFPVDSFLSGRWLLRSWKTKCPCFSLVLKCSGIHAMNAGQSAIFVSASPLWLLWISAAARLKPSEPHVTSSEEYKGNVSWKLSYVFNTSLLNKLPNKSINRLRLLVFTNSQTHKHSIRILNTHACCMTLSLGWHISSCLNNAHQRAICEFHLNLDVGLWQN